MPRKEEKETTKYFKKFWTSLKLKDIKTIIEIIYFLILIAEKLFLQ